MRKKIGLFTAILMFLLTALPVHAAGAQRVFDDAGLFSETAQNDLQSKIDVLQEEMKMDIVVVTSDEVPSGETTAYADDYYDYGGYGTRSDKSGVLFLIDMDNREIYISTCGDMVRVLTDAKVDAILDEVYTDMASQQYDAAANTFLSELQRTFENGLKDGDYQIDSATGQVVKAPKSAGEIAGVVGIALVVALAAGAIPCIVIKVTYQKPGKTGKRTKHSKQYQGQAQYAYSQSDDRLINEYVTRRVIPKSPPPSSSGGHSSGSSTHTSSSGQTHGGGGRKF